MDPLPLPLLIWRPDMRRMKIFMFITFLIAPLMAARTFAAANPAPKPAAKVMAASKAAAAAAAAAAAVENNTELSSNQLSPPTLNDNATLINTERNPTNAMRAHHNSTPIPAPVPLPMPPTDLVNGDGDNLDDLLADDDLSPVTANNMNLTDEMDENNNNHQTTTAGADDENWFPVSADARRALSKYMIAEFNHKNFTDSLAAAHNFGLGVVAPLDDRDSSSTSSNLFTSPGAGAPDSGVVGAPFNGSQAGGQQHLAGHVAAPALVPAQPRPYFGDAFYSFHNIYWPIHSVICLAICALGIFANVTNIIVLTRPNMITAVNTILSAMAFSDLIVNISNIPYLMHELSDSSNVTTFFSFQWALYILFHAHTSVTAHTISIWLTCVLATWRYFVVCRAPSTRNWSVSLAKRTIVGVFLIVPIFCIPNYLSFAIVKEVTETNHTIYKVGFSHLADESQFIKTFHFWIFSCLTKLVPCVLLTFFTTVIIRKLLKARERRLRLATYGIKNKADMDDSLRISMPNGGGGGLKIQKRNLSACETELMPINGFDPSLSVSKRERADQLPDDSRASSRVLISESSAKYSGQKTPVDTNYYPNTCSTRNNCNSSGETRKNNTVQIAETSQSSNGGDDVEILATSANTNASYSGTEIRSEAESSSNPTTNNQHPRIMSQMIVESSKNAANGTTILVTPTVTRMLSSNCDQERPMQSNRAQQLDPLRPASTCESFGCEDIKTLSDSHPLVQTLSTALQDLPESSTRGLLDVKGNSHHLMSKSAGASSATNLTSGDDNDLKMPDKRFSETNLGLRNKGRLTGSTTMLPLQMVKVQTAPRQLNQNETTTRLLIAVMIVFLICEFPAGILAALCAILGQDFFENVYQPTGILTDLLALINSSVNFILYCFMSTQFRITFYRVVLHCPAPNVPQHTQAIVTTAHSEHQNAIRERRTTEANIKIPRAQ